MKLKLIDDWRAAHRLWSVRLSALGAALLGALAMLPAVLPDLWAGLPADTRAALPAWLGFVVFAAALVSRLVKQEKQG